MSVFEFKPSEQRRKENNEKIKKMGIACLEELPLVEDSKQVKLKDTDTICKTAIATLLVIQVACDAMNDQYDEAMKMYKDLIHAFEAEKYLNKKQKKFIKGKYNKQDLINITWEYETYWSLIWALGLIDNEEIEFPYNTIDCEKAVEIVFKCNDYNDFKKQVKIRDIEEILDMLDLYYRYDWATTEHRINPETPIGNLDGEIVTERRKGLEWLISKSNDWDEISLDT